MYNWIRKGNWRMPMDAAILLNNRRRSNDSTEYDIHSISVIGTIWSMPYCNNIKWLYNVQLGLLALLSDCMHYATNLYPLRIHWLLQAFQDSGETSYRPEMPTFHRLRPTDRWQTNYKRGYTMSGPTRSLQRSDDENGNSATAARRSSSS